MNTLAKTSIVTIEKIFPDDKQAKQILSAAKRISKKRAAGNDAPSSSSPVKRKKKDTFSTTDSQTPAEIEASLALPISSLTDDELKTAVLHTNRAPLVLAFVTTLLKYTQPSQPISSRLSLAQAVVSVNSRSKAVSLGIEHGKAAEEEGWGQGQPGVTIMGRQIKVMRRWGYDPKDDGKDEQMGAESDSHSDDTQETIKNVVETNDEPPMWGLDLEALRSSSESTPHQSITKGAGDSGLPIHTAQSARAYLLKSFATAPSLPSTAENSSTKEGTMKKDGGEKKRSPAAVNAEKAQNLAKLLQALDLLVASWAPFISRDDLDKRAWSWYVAVRPDVQNGAAGWGGKGEVRLAQILEMRRKG